MFGEPKRQQAITQLEKWKHTAFIAASNKHISMSVVALSSSPEQQTEISMQTVYSTNDLSNKATGTDHEITDLYYQKSSTTREKITKNYSCST